MLAAFTESSQGPPLRNRIVLQAGDATYAVREGDWKLVERADPPDIRTAKPKRAERIANMRANAPQQDQLFFLVKDPSEENDVRELHPERAARMRELLALDRSASQTRP
jgi:arylsulfatase A-like enzyme